MTLKRLIKEEVKQLLKEYFHTTQDNRQLEVQDFLSARVDGDTLRELLRAPSKGRVYVRENFTERFYWWANEDVENLFKNWR